MRFLFFIRQKFLLWNSLLKIIFLFQTETLSSGKLLWLSLFCPFDPKHATFLSIEINEKKIRSRGHRFFALITVQKLSRRRTYASGSEIVHHTCKPPAAPQHTLQKHFHQKCLQQHDLHTNQKCEDSIAKQHRFHLLPEWSTTFRPHQVPKPGGGSSFHDGRYFLIKKYLGQNDSESDGARVPLKPPKIKTSSGKGSQSPKISDGKISCNYGADSFSLWRHDRWRRRHNLSWRSTNNKEPN